MVVKSLPLTAIGYMIPGEHGPVTVVSEQWGLHTAIVATEHMYNALQAPAPGPQTRAHIRRVS